ncbi:unnamed protein product [Caenorhabditis auriculariae]|uniref:RING-type domain-containing protein n=1 Tax=Caenorhabditis auriculariae TaxID=2777116 RepID=A0A8S1GYC6_9PELO|nr:unnamed protein product [Caenorhabditis auriculariae]
MGSREDEAEAREKVRELLSRPPSSRPADFVNPLEKIEQLLTCPICLDRYKQPKLLPCQHSFCYPCLESCADSLHRSLKCPECRAEHNIPYDGVKAFQPNYTLTGFLEIHLQATPESAAEIEEYIHRYNLERCKVCDEKADCEPCAHCDRKACKECRQTHMDMLKRDMSRLLNQVKRLSNRIIEASDNLSKGIELMSLNCETTKDEVREYFHRYQRDLKKREENFIYEIETFHATESRLMSNLRDVLEIESSNMSEAVARLDAAIKGECAIEDADLVRLKNTFTEGLDYLRNFQPDADELFNRKLRFSAGDDASKLPAAITTCGELCVLVPQFSGRYLPLEQSYLPRPFRLPLESDTYRVRGEDKSASHRENDRTSRMSLRNEVDEGSLRYKRRQQLEEEAWNRLRGAGTGADTERPQVRSPWLTKIDTSTPTLTTPQDSLHKTVEHSKTTSSVARKDVNNALAPPASSSLTSTPRTSPLPKHAVVASIPSPKTPEPASSEESLPDIRPMTRKPPLPRQASSNDDSLNEKVEVIRRAHAQRTAASRAVSSEESDGDEPTIVAPPRGRIRIVCRAASVNRDDGLTEHTPIQVTHFTGEDEVEIPAWLQRRRQRFQRSRTNPDIQSQFTSQRVQQLLAERQQRNSRLDSSTSADEEKRVRGRSASREAGEWRARGRPRTVFGRKGAKEGELNWPRGVCAVAGGLIAVCDSSNHRIVVFDKDGKYVRQFGGYGCASGQLDSTAGIASSKQRIVVSDRYNHRICIFSNEGEFVSTFGGHGQANGKFNNPWGVAVDELGSIYVADKDNHRVQVFDKNGQFIAKFGTFGHLPGQLNSPLFVAVSKTNHQVYVSDSSNHRICVFDPQGIHLFSFGEEGFHGGQFKFPRGIAIDSQENVLIADSGNNRIQVFDTNGQFVSSFGTWGSGAGQLKGVEDLCVAADGAIVATDRENHRIQIF